LQAQSTLEKAGITVSRSTIPFDFAKPWITNGIRLGTPSITTRGMNTIQAIEIAIS
jgi:glycine hydroxymethyltransferase